MEVKTFRKRAETLQLRSILIIFDLNSLLLICHSYAMIFTRVNEGYSDCQCFDIFIREI